ncbi:2-C-methyl-D-erythritol 4-phosphate cytidylyltransferase [Avibacterium sp. 21-586]|uniref:2-C-methyl-D-erythritol 4-phosphate cytidylyltransferase n=1 Tax=Avibacterium sp. 21-586 TaxID=2911534 RepID=UPI0022454486|nr:2-C-methyl-D-erythritol 4-phosphate cytidylyltransferase [Avibacterium sp. 21-586]MCW9710640.1 2-C-methyl-D-erythritol 4-phosphate cytidylyltransferase [Avibacterium sp. 21-586]
MSNTERKIIALVPAAGIGRRMNADRPKQYLTIHGKTILEHTLELLLSADKISRIVLAINPNDSYLSEINLLQHPNITLINGGETRAESVLNGLRAINTEENAWVMVHDAARPCLTLQELEALASITHPDGAILAIPAVDTIKRSNPYHLIEKTEDRTEIWLAQTPQFFPLASLKQAIEYALIQQQNITDESSAMELLGFKPQLVMGKTSNIKITHPDDLALAEFYLSQKDQHN